MPCSWVASPVSSAPVSDQAVADERFRSGPPLQPAAAPTAVPRAVAAALVDAEWEQIWVKRGSEVWRVATADGMRFVKVGWAGERAPLADEVARLEWAHDRLPLATPEVLAVDLDGDRAWVVTRAIEGIPAHDPRWRGHVLEAMVEGVGAGLRRLHDADPSSCPFALPTADLLASAERRVAAGGVDPEAMRSDTYRRMTAEGLLDHLRATRPEEPAADRVIAHGDAVLPNVILRPPDGAPVGVVDLGRLAVSDRYRDLGVLARSLAQNLGPELGWRLFDAYGLPHPDPLRLEWYALADDMW
jgi:aminoglycoside 3'-phosphotransferase II